MTISTTKNNIDHEFIFAFYQVQSTSISCFYVCNRTKIYNLKAQTVPGCFGGFPAINMAFRLNVSCLRAWSRFSFSELLLPQSLYISILLVSLLPVMGR